jgi:hypothetical protein
LKTEAYAHGYLYVDVHTSVTRIYGTPSRVLARKEYIWNSGARERLLQSYRDLAARIATGPMTEDIAKFYDEWDAIKGYGPRDTEVRIILAVAKNSIISHVLALADREGWTYGRQFRPLPNGYSELIYVDTPQGQVSFHVRPEAHGDMPPYPWRWSGKRNTGEILQRVFTAR